MIFPLAEFWWTFQETNCIRTSSSDARSWDSGSTPVFQSTPGIAVCISYTNQ